MEVRPGETGYDLDARALQIVRGTTEDAEWCGECGWNDAPEGSPAAVPSNCSASPPPCGLGQAPAFTSDPRADLMMLEAVKRWEETRRRRFWDILTNLLLENAGHTGDLSRFSSQLYLMTYYLPGDYTRAALRML